MNTNSYQIYKICQDCGKDKAYNEHPLCKSCAMKMVKSNSSKIMTTETKKKISDSVKKSLQTHHIDLNPENNNDDNLLKLSIANHKKLHMWAYRYLVTTNQISDYIKWFFDVLKNQEINKIKNEEIQIKIDKLQEKIIKLKHSRY